jgi:ubiquinone/menaquinone biosynthesis C-methylase UbiE
MSNINYIENMFTNIYLNDGWNMGQNESKSGLGSTLLYTENIRKELVQIIQDKSISNMLDTSCGDWYWMKLIQNELCDYTGIDVVKKIVENNNNNFSNGKTRFVHSDFLTYIKNLPDKSIDLIFCRHTLEHLPSGYNISFLNEAKRVCKYLLVTGYNDINKKNIELLNSTYRPINLEFDPYSSILSQYNIYKFYDGPTNFYASEMYMYMYKF